MSNLQQDEEPLQTLLNRCSGLLRTHQSLSRSPTHKLPPREIPEQKEEVLPQSSSKDSKLSQQPPTLLTVNSSKQTTHLEIDKVEDNKVPIIEDRHAKCMLLVFQYLSIPELCRIRIVCKSWYRTALHPLLWQRVVLSDIPLTSKALVTIATSCTQTKHISLQGLTPPPATPTQDLKGYIDKQKGSLEMGLKVLLSTCASNLLSLSIIQCPLVLTDKALWIISVTCPRLLSFSYHSHEFPPTPESLWSLSNGCHEIQSLHLHPSQETELDSASFTDKCLYHISQGFPLLVHLTMGGAGITINGLLRLVSSVRQLRYLHLINGPSINLNTADKLASLLKVLDTLIITHTAISPQAIIKIIDTHPNLLSVQVAISFTDYYCEPSDLSDQISIQKYQKILTNFKVISEHQYYNHIFTMSIKPIMTSFGYSI